MQDLSGGVCLATPEHALLLAAKLSGSSVISQFMISRLPVRAQN